MTISLPMSGAGRWVSPDSLGDFAAAYPGKPVGLHHLLHDHPLFSREALAALAGSLPDSHVEHSLGDLAVDQDPDGIRRSTLTPAEIVRTLDNNGCWMVLKKVDADPAYAALIDACLEEIAPVVRPATGGYLRREAFIFLSSPNSVTPYHMDPEHNILFQISGGKRMRIFAADPFTIVPARQHETFHRGGTHRNMKFDPAFDACATDFDLRAGDAVYVPVKTPHWVRNGPVPSISFSVTWRSVSSDHEARLHRVNHRLRNIGLHPALPGSSPLLDAVKIAVHRAVKGAARSVKRLAGRKIERSAY